MTRLEDRLGAEHRGQSEPTTTCAVPTCRRSAVGGRICPSDQARLGQWLADVGADWQSLDPIPDMTSPGAGRTSGGALASHRAPARLDVLVLTDPRSRARDQHDPDGNPHRSVPEILGSWAATVRDERHLTQTAGYNVPADRRLLADHLDWIASRDWIDDFHTEIRDIWAQLKAATGQTTGSRPVRACPAPIGQPPARCNGPVWLDTGAAWCGHCGAAWSGFQLVRLMSAVAA